MIRIMIKHPTTGTRQTAVVPERAAIRNLVPKIIEKMQPPPPLIDPRGRPISYMLNKNESGLLRLLMPYETLASAGVQEDEELTLTFRVVAG